MLGLATDLPHYMVELPASSALTGRDTISVSEGQIACAIIGVAILGSPSGPPRFQVVSGKKSDLPRVSSLHHHLRSLFC